MISTVTGQFNTFDGTAQTNGDDFEGATIEFSADVSSLSTNSADRDKHLKSVVFFNADHFPKLSFKSTSFTKSSNDTYHVIGDLTMHGVTKEVTLEAEFGGNATDGYGNNRAGFEVKGKIDRKEFGMTFNMAAETGGVVVGNEVKLIANVQFIKDKAE